jgi:hypothetical protein
MPKSASGLLSPPGQFWFRRRRFGDSELPLVLQPGKAAAEADELPYCRASGVSDLIKDLNGLTTWKINGHMNGVGNDESLLLSVQAVEDWESDEGKKRYRELRKWAERVSKMTDKRENGTALHALFVSVSHGRELPATMASRYLELIAAHQRMISLFTVSGFEQTVVCDELGIAGNLDIMGSPRAPMTPVNRKGKRIAPDVEPGQQIVMDVKTSSGKNACKYMGEHALQIAPYARSVGYHEVEDPVIAARHREELSWDEFKSPGPSRARVAEFVRTPHGARGDVGLIFHASSEGTEVHLHWLDLNEGFEAARHAMVTRQWRNKLGGLCAPAAPPDLLKVLEAVETREEALALYALHKDNGWTDEHMAVCLQRWPRKAA